MELRDREDIADNLEALAQLLATHDEAPKAVCLWSAAQALRRNLGLPLRSTEQKTYDQQLQQTRLTLGEEAFAAAWTEGGTLTWERAVELALADAEP